MVQHRSEARRVTLFEDAEGLWTYRAQGWNWRTLTHTTIGAQRKTLERIIRREYPGVEIVVQSHD